MLGGHAFTLVWKSGITRKTEQRKKISYALPYITNKGDLDEFEF